MSELSLCELDHLLRSSLHLKQTLLALVTWPLPSMQVFNGARTWPSLWKLFNILFLLSFVYLTLCIHTNTGVWHWPIIGRYRQRYPKIWISITTDIVAYMAKIKFFSRLLINFLRISPSVLTNPLCPFCQICVSYTSKKY